MYLNPSDEKNKLATHTPNSVCIYLVCTHDESKNKKYEFYGENCIYDMVVKLNEIAEECIAKTRENCEMEVSKSDENDFKFSKKCHICDVVLIKVMLKLEIMII